VRLWTFDRETPVEEVMATAALEARNPLLATVTTGQGRSLPAMQSGVTVSRKGVALTAFGQNPDGTGTLLRVWEQAGVSGGLTITIPGNFTSATAVNLRGEPLGQPQALSAGKIAVALEKFAPAGFILE
jgi:alpha-mannosidase